MLERHQLIHTFERRYDHYSARTVWEATLTAAGIEDKAFYTRAEVYRVAAALRGRSRTDALIGWLLAQADIAPDVTRRAPPSDADQFNEHIEQLRHLLHGPAGRASWRAVCALFDQMAEDQGKRIALEYAAALLEGWSDAERVLLDAWLAPFCDPEPAPWLGLVRCVELELPTLERLAPLLESPRMPQVTRLHLSGTDIEATYGVVEAIASATGACGLKALVLRELYDQVYDEGIDALIASPHLRLTHLSLEGATELSGAAVARLATAPSMAGLEWLDLRGCIGVEPETVTALEAGLGQLRTLVRP